MKWNDLRGYQKAAFWNAIVFATLFAPEITLLLHFGGIEVVFAFIAYYFSPLFSQIQVFLTKIQIAAASYQNSASAKPKVFFVQAAFCSLAFVTTGSIAFAGVFFMPSLAFNGVLI
ncbi:hypothetical protein [Alteromonas oceanisediminis]|uniref:hypothetical protein n=1 Tax=Alteromonas oceanisediminis TaxID=2836180 RepID=UPI001BDB3505|nr:hypothetical protein [Alteromonas oceanisediminis]MBT0587181.1 hypothetical protein [Alteromonas oceanisediminis]